MASCPVLTTPPATSSAVPEYFDEPQPEFVDSASPTMALRGILTGISFGAVLWAGILVLAGVIKL